MQTWPHLDTLNLADPDFLTLRPVDLIIGADHCGQVIKPNIVYGSPTEPYAQLSIFGWLVLGPVHAAHAVTCTAPTATAQPEDALLQELLTKFWTQEEPPSDTPGQLTPEQEECEAYFRSTHTRDSSGKYVVRIPLKSAVTLLGDSYRTAHRCLQQMLRRLTRDDSFRTLYHRFMEEYQELGHMVKAPTNSSADEVHYYLPHHGVLRPDRETTKLRVVFNGSAATTSGLSFNDISHTWRAKWHSTHQDLLKSVSSANTKDHLSLDDCATKILGTRWLPHDDKFVFSSGFSPPTEKLTKRIVLSEVAQIFDPLGSISPVTIRAKMLLHELWLHKIGWDDALPAPLSVQWLNLREDLTCLARLSIPRWLKTRADSAVTIHGFSDASQLAMSAVVYIVVSSPSTVAQATHVCSKTKVAPLKRLTIPRLELTAALLLAKRVKYVQAALHLTLMWIRSHSSRWKDYVRNRVAQIQELTADAHWRHVSGVANPADCASRGVNTF